jgi:hypothetical protein
VGKLKIHNREIKDPALDNLQGILLPEGGSDLIAGRFKPHLYEFQNILIVVDHQDLSGCHIRLFPLFSFLFFDLDIHLFRFLDRLIEFLNGLVQPIIVLEHLDPDFRQLGPGALRIIL